MRQLTRLKLFDENSRKFPIRTLIGNKKPRSYTWRCNEWLDQGSQGACVAYSFGHELIARPKEVKLITNEFLINDIYFEAQKIDPWEGGAYENAIPFYEGTSVLSGVKILHKLGYYESYNWGFGIDDLVLGLGYAGPAVLGINWYESMDYPDENGYIEPLGNIAGGHAVLARGISLKKNSILFRNSWGQSWGINGDFWMKIPDVDKLLKEDGESVFPLKRKLTI